jgi:putative holliday junction resolvase
MARILALDIGQKRTGVSVTDPLQLIASALDTVPTEQIVPYLQKYLASENVEKLVVGLPVTLQNEPSSNHTFVLQTIRQLRKAFPTLALETHDERFTSSMAKQTVLASGINKKARQKKENMDKISATLILQSYMEHRSLQSN